MTRDGGPQRGLVLTICAAQCGAQIGAFAVPTLLPTFIDRWALSNTEAGWLAGIFYAGYTVSVPVLVSLTDRIDPRRIYLACVTLTFLAMTAYATVVDDFWSAFLCRLVHGIGWAGTYMPGLKALSDRFQGKEASRPVAAHAAAVGISGAMSFLVTGVMESLFGWRSAMAVGAAGAALAFALMAWRVAPKAPEPAAEARALLDFRPVFRNRAAIAFSIGYLVHTWEMSALRGWTVTFLSEAGEVAGRLAWLPPAVVATGMGFLGVWASVLGNEAAIRFGRRRAVMLFMLASIAVSLGIGLTVAAGYPVAAAAVILYAILIWGDSSTLTAGASTNAAPGQRGATLAVHSTLGYFGGFLGPIIMGLALDAGGGGAFAWWLGFAHLALVIGAGLAAFLAISPREVRGG